MRYEVNDPSRPYGQGITRAIRAVLNLSSAYWLVLLYGCFVYGYRVTGRMPQLGNPKPQYLFNDYYLYLNLLNFSMVVLAIGVVVNGLHIMRFFGKSKASLDLLTWFFVLNVVLWLIHFFGMDPFGASDWFMD